MIVDSNVLELDLGSVFSPKETLDVGTKCSNEEFGELLVTEGTSNILTIDSKSDVVAIALAERTTGTNVVPVNDSVENIVPGNVIVQTNNLHSQNASLAEKINVFSNQDDTIDLKIAMSLCKQTIYIARMHRWLKRSMLSVTKMIQLI